MGKPKPTSSSKKEVYPYPSFCGSHASMVVQSQTEQLGDEKYVVCKDFWGLYVTEAKNLDNGMGDPWRCADPAWRVKNLEYMNGQVVNVIVHPGQL